jgi:hypothetical protein
MSYQSFQLPLFPEPFLSDHDRDPPEPWLSGPLPDWVRASIDAGDIRISDEIAHVRMAQRWHSAEPRDWIIKLQSGNLFVCSPELFEIITLTKPAPASPPNEPEPPAPNKPEPLAIPTTRPSSAVLARSARAREELSRGRPDAPNAEVEGADTP